MRSAHILWAVVLVCQYIASEAASNGPTRDAPAAWFALSYDPPALKEATAGGHQLEDAATMLLSQPVVPPHAPLPVPTIDGVPPVATAMKCIISMAALFFIVYTLLFAVQAANGLGLMERVLEEKYLSSAAETVFFVPMLCILFLAARMRAVQLAQGDTERYGLPQWWTKWAMISCFWCMLAQTVLTLVCASLYGEWWEDTGRRQGLLGKILSASRYAIIFGMYVSFSTVCVGICTMTAPVQIWGPAGAPPVSPAVFCTMFLSVQYFAVYAALAISRTASWSGVFGESLRFGYWQDIFKQATTTVAFAPMLCVLYVAARLRALQLDPVNGHPMIWAQTCFYLSTFSVTLLTCLVLLGALAMQQGGRARPSSEDTEAQKPDNGQQDIKRALELTRWVVMAILYGSIVAVIISLPLQPLPDGTYAPAATSGSAVMPAALRSTIVLTAVYFGVYLCMWLVTTYRRFINTQEVTPGLVKLCNFLAAAKDSVDFSPMLCVLFLGTMLRAMQLTGGRGAPQDWVQDAMWVAVWSVIFHTIAHVDLCLDGSQSPTLSAAFAVVQYVCLLVMYGAVCSVIVGLYVMTPQTAVGRGSLAPGAASWVVQI